MQDVTHQLNAAMTELQANKNTWFQKTLTSFSGLKERSPSAPSTQTPSTRSLSPTLPKTTFSRNASIDSTNSSSQRNFLWDEGGREDEYPKPLTQVWEYVLYR